MLHIEGVSHRYAGGVEALTSVNVTVDAGEFVCVVGPSGCGKTTLLHIIAGLIRPTQGLVRLNGSSIDRPRREIGLIFQKSNLMPWRTVRDNLALPLELEGIGAAERYGLAESMLERLGLLEFGGAYPAELSGGMAQRVAIGRALIHDPAVLLLDEPFGALDAMTREQMQIELLHIWSNARKTAIMVTHSITEAVFTADRVLVMSRRPGRIRAEIDIPLPRPRRLEMIHAPEFGTLSQRIREGIEDATAR